MTDTEMEALARETEEVMLRDTVRSPAAIILAAFKRVAAEARAQERAACVQALREVKIKRAQYAAEYLESLPPFGDALATKPSDQHYKAAADLLRRRAETGRELDVPTLAVALHSFDRRCEDGDALAARDARVWNEAIASAAGVASAFDLDACEAIRKLVKP